MTPVEPDTFSWLRTALAFGVVAGLLGLLGFGLRFVAARGFQLPMAANRARRLEIKETLTLDIRRRLVIVRCDNTEHLLLLGTNNDTVVAQLKDKE